MDNRKFVQKCTLALSLLLLVLSAGCTTEYGYDYIESDIVRADLPKYENLQIRCALNKTQLSIELTGNKLLRDYRYTYRQGIRRFNKEFCAFSQDDKKLCLPFLTFFPCVRWGMSLLYTDDYSENLLSWGPLLGPAIVFNSIFACGDILYYCGSFCWSIGAVPAHYILTRSAKEVNSYRQNQPDDFSVFMGKPVVNLLFPGYIRPDKNPGPMCVKEELYSKPSLIRKTLHKEISLTESRRLRKYTPVTITFNGKTYSTKTIQDGKCVLPFKIHPLPIRQEKFTVQIDAYKTYFSPLPVDLLQEYSFDTSQFLNSEQKTLWSTVQNPTLDLMKRFRAMKRLEALFTPEEFQKFKNNPKQYTDSLVK